MVPTRQAGCVGGPLALVFWMCACSSSGPAAPTKAAPSLSVPVSINGRPAQALTLALDGEGFSPSILSVIPGPNEGPWSSFEVDGEGTARLLIALSHYPDAEPVLHKDMTTGTVLAGLRSNKTHRLMPGFFTASPSLVAVYDKGHLQTGEALASAPLVVRFADHAEMEVLAAELQELVTYAPAGAKGKTRWWRLSDVLRQQGPDPGPLDQLVVHYSDPKGLEQTMEISMDALRTRPDSFLLKVNRRGQWKLSVVAPDRETQTVHAILIEVRARQ